MRCAARSRKAATDRASLVRHAAPPRTRQAALFLEKPLDSLFLSGARAMALAGHTSDTNALSLASPPDGSTTLKPRARSRAAVFSSATNDARSRSRPFATETATHFPFD